MMQTPLVPLKRRQRLDLGPAIERFLESVKAMSHGTEYTYRFRLHPFVHFLREKGTDVQSVMAQIKAGQIDTYAVLGEYAGHLQTVARSADGKGAASIKRRVNVVKLLFIFHDVEFNETKFKNKVKLPKSIRREKQPIDKNDVRRILHACDDIRVKTYLLLLASTGMRAKEALHLRFSDFELEAEPARINIRGEYTKTRTDRYVFLTREFVMQFKDYSAWRQRPRSIAYYDYGPTGGRREVVFMPENRPEDRVFAMPHRDPKKNAAVESMYKNISRQANMVIQRAGLGELERHSGQRKITRHTFRRFVKSTVSDLGYADYSEWLIGHVGSTYYRKKEAEQAQLFAKIEPYLTFLDVGALEAQGADVQAQIDSLRSQHERELAEMKAEMQQEITALKAALFAKDAINKYLQSPNVPSA